MSKILELERVEKLYSAGTPLEVRALRGVDFSMEEGDFVYVLGPSGSGKTTLLNMAGLLDSPTEGRVVLNGVDTSLLTDGEQASLRSSSLGFVFQQPSFLPEFTAWENVVLPALIAGESEKSVSLRAAEMFDRMQMAPRRGHFPPQLSGGELQRLTILRALINRPSLILCDEPTGQLDEDNASAVMDTLREFAAGRAAGVLFVTHNRELTKGAKTVINLRNGEIMN